MNRKSVMVIAGEMSGDLHAARLVRSIREKRPDILFFGIGGDQLLDAGVELLHHVEHTAVLGLTEVLPKLRFFRKLFREMVEIARIRKPDAVLLVDYPGFNLRFAKKARAMGLRVIYYICPQVWAWRRGRIKEMATTVDRLIAIFPFEKEVFADTGLRVDVVSHPLAAPAAAALAEPLAPLPWKGEPRIALLPGSREQEMRRMLPVMRSAAGRLERMFPGASFIVAAPDENMAQRAADLLEHRSGGPTSLAVVAGKTRQILRQARAAWVASGTATLEAALMRCPMVIIYKTSWANYLLGSLLVKLPFLGMVNIIAGKPVCPELLQHKAAPSRMVSALAPLISDGNERSVMLQELESVAEKLEATGIEAADIVLNELK